MKTITLILILILLTLNVIGQSHTYKNNKGTTLEEGEWGRWIPCSDEIEVKTEKSEYWGIYYKISIYMPGAMHPDVVLEAKFSNMKDEWFKYKVIGGRWLVISNEGYILTNVKLSEMSSGNGGELYIYIRDTGSFNDTGFAYILSN